MVGAGFAGLSAARDLVASGKDVALLEARPFVGGRTLGADLGDGKSVELGGQWAGRSQTRVVAAASAVGVSTFPTYCAGKKLLLWRGRLRRFGGDIPPLSPPTLIDYEIARRRLERLAASVPGDAPWEAPHAEALDMQTLGSWTDRHMRTRDARKLFRLVSRTLWGADPGEISLLHALFFVRGAGNFTDITTVVGGSQELRFEGGTQRVAERMAEALGDRVLTGHPVRSITQRNGGLELRTEALTVSARRAIVTVPPPLTSRIEHSPPLPVARVQMGQRMPLGSIAKVCAVYPEPFWRANGLNGQAISDCPPVTLTFDNSPPDGLPGVLVGFVGGVDARVYGRAAEEARHRAVVDCFVRLFGREAAHPTRVIEQRWSTEPWIDGGPTANPVPGTWSGFGHALREPAGRVHWAGSETAPEWYGYVEGAVRSGERAAAEVIAAEA